MDKITHQVRAEQWTRILNECMSSGMSKTAWCRANGISEKQFFYWQRILRKEAFENSSHQELPAVTKTSADAVSFTEVKLLSAQQTAASLFRPDIVIRKGDLTCEISNSASEVLLSQIGGILHAE